MTALVVSADHLVLALVAATLSSAILLVGRCGGPTLDGAAVVAVAVLAVRGQAPPATVVAVVALATAGHVHGRLRLLARLAALGALAAAATSLPVGPALVLVALGALTAATPRALAEVGTPATAAGLLAVACAGLWAAAPDTEGAIALGAALAPVAVATLTSRRPSPASWAPAVLALWWAAAWGFRGRPGGLPLVLLLAAVLVVGPLVALRCARAAPPVLRGPPALVAVAAAAVVVAVSARTYGLGGSALGGALPALGGCSLVVAGAAFAGRRHRTPPPGDGPHPADL
ncbi:hypothetical protein PO878_15210 [Iamia majanohamensis]|uniref:Uncharacterized protein n=1 Tax=Iamia majanohamensis TaxID=467976 RepID=A0AAE9Y5K0_9ACTN|nr:hypothetical protein [Iamia majanohamensis]WCO65851.1 hypothetical protein PO878_15210 [Iamia majanohamensis]